MKLYSSFEMAYDKEDESYSVTYHFKDVKDMAFFLKIAEESKKFFADK